MEVWKVVEEYPTYSVSNTGNVKNNNYRGTGVERPLKLMIDKDGYCVVNLSVGGKYKTKKVHRLVAQAFIPNKDCLPMINHKDENRANNTVENLEWCDAKYNSNYGNGIQKSSNARSHPVVCVETGEVFKNGVEVSKRLGLDMSTFYKCLREIPGRKTYGGYHWRLVNSEVT